ncbi:chorismate mutase [Bryobacter aggregatus]|uniref:chorismate mutase n=1 Tax=Bryobacter aggregatus TaxID=360054 RepID=UPI0004E1B82A|nr:chorismate mutase [Bryobacter aggregatus]
MSDAKTQEVLLECRGRIDALDEKIILLLNERAEVALEIGQAKANAGLPVVELGRERVVIDRMVGKSTGPLDPDAVERIYTVIMMEMRRLQER